MGSAIDTLCHDNIYVGDDNISFEPATQKNELLGLLIKLLKKRVVAEEAGVPDHIPGVDRAFALNGLNTLVVKDVCLVAVESVKLGANPLFVATLLQWRDFEKFVSQAFDSFGYKVKHDHRFSLNGIKRQVDILAQKRNMVVSVDCKHWTKTHSFRTAVTKHIERSTLLARSIPRLDVLPVIVTLGFSNVVEGVPIVAAYALRDFLLNLEDHIEEFLVIRI
jgi:hypothetical protein